MKLRVSLAALMAVVAILALGLAAMREASSAWLHATYTVTVALLAVGLLGSLLKSRPRGAWVGFALFGWGAFCLDEVPAAQFLGADLLNTGVERALIDRLHHPPAVPGGLAVPSVWRRSMSAEEQAEWVARNPLGLAREMKEEAQMAGTSVAPAIEDYLDKTDLYREHTLNSSQIAGLLRCLILALLGATLGVCLEPKDQTVSRPVSEAPEALS